MRHWKLAVAGVLTLACVGLGIAVAWRGGWLRSGERALSASADARCAEHGVPERFDTLCHPELEASLLGCDEHGGIPEDLCTLCHPELTEKLKLELCAAGHGLPVHFCYLCRVSQGVSAGTKREDGWCATHNRPEEQCTACIAAGDARPKDCGLALPTVRLKRPDLARSIGIQVAEVKAETHAHSLEANAETDFDTNHFAEITPRVSGYLLEVSADLGRVVKAGEVLAVVDSPAVGAAKARYITAVAGLELKRSAYERVRELTRQEALPGKQELEARTELNRAESEVLDVAQSLRNLGFAESELSRIATEKKASGLLEIKSPIEGEVVERHAVRGEAVQETSRLFALTDTSRLWLWIDVYESDIGKLGLGMPVWFTPSGAEARARYEGSITWLGAQVDAVTRTTRVRAELNAPPGRLRANQFGHAVIQVEPPHDVLVIPRSAVQRHDEADVVFIPDSSQVYQPQRIVTKPSTGRDDVEVVWGLKAGTKVVTRGSFWLKTEIMKGSIGAGCCE